MTPTISTLRLVMRPLTKPSSRALRWLRDPDVVRYSEQRHLEHTVSTELRFLQGFTHNSHIWSINDVKSGEHIGNITARHDAANNISEVGILIGESGVWGKGLGSEAWKAVCDWLLDPNHGNCRKLEAGCMRSNIAMVKMLRSARFREEGELLNHFLLDGNPVSCLMFGRMK